MNETRPSQSPLLRLLISYIFFLFSVQVLTIGLSLLHVHITAWAARLILLASVIVGLILFLVGTRDWKGFNFLGDKFRGWKLLVVFLVIAAGVYLVLWLASWEMPDLSWDGNGYHIPAIAMWDWKGYIHWVNTPFRESLINGYPKGAELMAYVTVKAFGNNFINTVNLWFLPVGVLGIAYLGILLGANPLLSLCAGAAFLLVPVNINQGVTTYVDSAFAACAVGVIALSARLSSMESTHWRESAAFGAVAGLALAVKSTGLAVAGLAILAVLSAWIIDRLRTTSLLRRTLEHTDAGNGRIRIIPALVIILLFLLAGGGYWYLRNWVHTGSPLYPVGLSLLGHTVFPGGAVSETLGAEHNLPVQLENIPAFARFGYTWMQGLHNWPADLKDYDSRLGGLGFLWLLGCIPAIILTIINFRKLKPGQKRVFIVLLALTGLAFIVIPLNWWARYTEWIYALGLSVLAFVITDLFLNKLLRAYQKYVSTAWMLVVTGLLLLEGAYCTLNVIAQASPGSLRSSLAHFFEANTWKWQPGYLYPDMENTSVAEVLGQPDNVAIGPRGSMDFGRYSGVVGELCQPIGLRQVLFLTEDDNFSNIIALKEVKYVLWDESVSSPLELKAKAISVEHAAGFIVITLP